MRANRRPPRIDRCLLVALCAAIAPVPAWAQATPTDQIDMIEKQIRNLQGEVQRLKRDLRAAKKQLRQSQGNPQRSPEEARQAGPATAGATIVQSRAPPVATKTPPAAALPAAASDAAVSLPGGRPTITSADGRASFAVGAQFQFDMGGYFQNPSPTTEFPMLDSGVNLRRARIFFIGNYEDFTVRITPDFADLSPTLYEANIDYSGIKPITATVGYYKPWFTLYDSQSSNDFLLLERPTIVDISRNLAAGDARASAGFKATTDRYFLSSYLTGVQYGEGSTSLNRGQLGFAGRVSARPYYDKDWNIDLGISGEAVFHPNLTKSGVPFVSQQTLTLENQPELRIDRNDLISTGALSASSANSYGGGVGISWRNFLVQGEYYRIQVNQLLPPGAPSPALGFSGFYVEGGWVVTGEPIRYSTGSAAFARPKVAEPFSLGGGLGAWELSARWSVMNLNSNVTPGVPQAVTGGIYGGYQQIFGTALSWYPNDQVRLMLQFQYVNVNKLDSLGTTQIGQSFETLAGRAQFAF